MNWYRRIEERVCLPKSSKEEWGIAEANYSAKVLFRRMLLLSVTLMLGLVLVFNLGDGWIWISKVLIGISLPMIIATYPSWTWSRQILNDVSFKTDTEDSWIQEKIFFPIWIRFVLYSIPSWIVILVMSNES